MSGSEQMPELDELEPLEEAPETASEAGGPPSIPQQTLNTLRSGLAPPAFNPRADKEYYRFLFASLVILLGGLMPWAWDLNHAGYKTVTGGVITLFAIGLVWRWWAAIHTRNFGGKDLFWVVIALVPLVWLGFALGKPFEEPGVADWGAARGIEDWGGLFDAVGAEDGGLGVLGEFFRAFGTGRLFVLVGCLLLEVFMVMAIFGGAKKVKEQKAAARAAASERRRR